MSFRQFPATGNDGNTYISLEFHAPNDGGEEPLPLRYELADGQRLQRHDGERGQMQRPPPAHPHERPYPQGSA